MKEKTCYLQAQKQERLKADLIKLLRLGVQYFGTGGALGFDTMDVCMNGTGT